MAEVYGTVPGTEDGVRKYGGFYGGGGSLFAAQVGLAGRRLSRHPVSRPRPDEVPFKQDLQCFRLPACLAMCGSLPLPACMPSLAAWLATPAPPPRVL